MPPTIKRIGNVRILAFDDGTWIVLGLVTDEEKNRDPDDDGRYPSFDPEIEPPPSKGSG